MAPELEGKEPAVALATLLHLEAVVVVQVFPEQAAAGPAMVVLAVTAYPTAIPARQSHTQAVVAVAAVPAVAQVAQAAVVLDALAQVQAQQAQPTQAAAVVVVVASAAAQVLAAQAAPAS